MSSSPQISGRVVAAGRALAGVNRTHFANAAGLSPSALRRLESSGSASVGSPDQIEAVLRGLDHFGVMIVEEADGKGAGVRLRFTRSDARQISRLESEGGTIGSDAAS